MFRHICRTVAINLFTNRHSRICEGKGIGCVVDPVLLIFNFYVWTIIVLSEINVQPDKVNVQ